MEEEGSDSRATEFPAGRVFRSTVERDEKKKKGPRVAAKSGLRCRHRPVKATQDLLETSTIGGGVESANELRCDRTRRKGSVLFCFLSFRWVRSVDVRSQKVYTKYIHERCLWSGVRVHSLVEGEGERERARRGEK
jgi:hypothetical protein